MDVVDTWTGRTACVLQQALRMTNDRFAEHLGVAVRTVAGWHSDPNIVPRTEMQAALDTAYERAPAAVLRRFSAITRPAAGPVQAQALRVAVAVVVRRDEVLLVCRRGDGQLSWQFPAGEIEGGENAEQAAVRETQEETGLTVEPVKLLGERVHPKTGRHMAYTACCAVGGEAHVADEDELAEVAWITHDEIPQYVPYGLFGPVQEYLDGVLLSA